MERADVGQNVVESDAIRARIARVPLRLIWLGALLAAPFLLLMLDFPLPKRHGPAALDLSFLLSLMIFSPPAVIGAVLAAVGFLKLIRLRPLDDSRVRVAALIGFFGLLLYLPGPFVAFRFGDLIKADMPRIDGLPGWHVFYDQYAPFGLVGIMIMFGTLVLFTLAVRTMPTGNGRSQGDLPYFTMRRFSMLLIGVCALLIVNRFISLGHVYWIAAVIVFAAIIGRAIYRIPTAAERKRRGLFPLAIGLLGFCYCYALGVNTALSSGKPWATLPTAAGCALAIACIAFGYVRRFYRVVEVT